VSGTVTDQVTGEPIPLYCSITMGRGVRRTDHKGRYVINRGRYHARAIKFVAPGYQTVTLPVDWSQSRRPVIDVQMVPKSTPPSAEELSQLR
jgi:hypothetical protein